MATYRKQGQDDGVGEKRDPRHFMEPDGRNWKKKVTADIDFKFELLNLSEK